MAISLIETLNANVAKSPDEIVKAISSFGFIRCVDLTEDQYNTLRDQPVYFYSTRMNTWEMSTDYPSRRHASLRALMATWDDFRAGWWDGWWVIRAEDVREGMPCPES